LNERDKGIIVANILCPDMKITKDEMVSIIEKLRELY